LYPLSLLPAALLVGTFLQYAVAQETLAVPDIMPPAGVLSAEETPPPPIAAPLESVDITPPHLIELQQKFRDHPGQRRAVCAMLRSDKRREQSKSPPR
jgi:hypothetical protein